MLLEEKIGSLNIYTIGDTTTREFRAVEELKNIFKAALKNETGRLFFVSNYYGKKEIDIIVIGDFDKKFKRLLKVKNKNENVNFDRFILLIEVKDNPNIRFEEATQSITVIYQSNKGTVNNQVMFQMKCLKEDLLEKYGLECFIATYIWLRNLKQSQADKFNNGENNIIANMPSFDMIMQKSYLKKNLKKINGGYCYDAVYPDNLRAFKVMCNSILQQEEIYSDQERKAIKKNISLLSAIIEAGERLNWDVFEKPFSPKDLGIDSSKYGSFSDYCKSGTTRSSKWNKHEILEPVEFDNSGKPKKYLLISSYKDWIKN